MSRFKRFIPVFLIALLLMFFVEVILHMEMEKVLAETYALRDEIIVLKLKNREMKIEIEEATDVKNVRKWAKKHGFTKQWSADGVDEIER